MSDLFDYVPPTPPPAAHARRTDPSTSHEAAAKVTKKLTQIQEDVLAAFREHGPMTDLDLQKRFNFNGSTHRTRRSELVAKNLLRDTGRKVKQDGSNRIIWEAVS